MQQAAAGFLEKVKNATHSGGVLDKFCDPKRKISAWRANRGVGKEGNVSYRLLKRGIS